MNSVSAKSAFNLGMTYKKSDDYPNCLKYLKESLFRNPTYKRAALGIIECNYYAGNFESTLYWSEKYLKLNQNKQKAQIFRTLALSKLRKLKDS